MFLQPLDHCMVAVLPEGIRLFAYVLRKRSGPRSPRPQRRRLDKEVQEAGPWAGLHPAGGGRRHSGQQVQLTPRHEDRNAGGIFKAKD